MSRKELTQEFIKEILFYDPLTGIFTWRKPTGSKMKIGQRAGCKAPIGYNLIKINRKLYRTCRLAFLYMTGGWPIEIDHINKNKSDDRWNNLRNGDRAANNYNKDLQSNNKSGYTGVSFDKRDNNWDAHCYKNGKRYYIGAFSSPKNAYEARMKWLQTNDLQQYNIVQPAISSAPAE